MISGQAKIAGVMGWPVAHSLSPRLHGFWLDHHGVDGAYIPIPVSPDDIDTVIKTLPKLWLLVPTSRYPIKLLRLMPPIS